MIQHMTLVLEAMDLCAQEKAVLLAICNHTDATGKTFAGEQRLMREAGMPRTTFQRWRAKLVERDLLISREKRNGRNQRLTSDTWVNLGVLRSMRDPFFEHPGKSAAEEDANPFDVSAGQSQAPSVGPGSDVQAPSVGHPGPVSGAWLGPVSGALNHQMNPHSSMARADEDGIDSVAAAQEATDDDVEITSELNTEQVDRIVSAVMQVRGDWQAPGIRAQIRQVSHLPFDVVYSGFIRGATDTAMRTPMNLATAAQEYASQQQERESAEENRALTEQAWRQEVNQDVSNRSTPETRKAYAMAAKAGIQRARQQAQETRTGG